MNIRLGVRTLALLAFVAAATMVLVHPELIDGAAPATPLSIDLPVVGHH